MITKQAKHHIDITTSGDSCGFDKEKQDTKSKEIIVFHNKTENTIRLDFSSTDLFGVTDTTIEDNDKDELVVQSGPAMEFECTVECNAGVTSDGSETTDTESTDTTSDSTVTSSEETTTTSTSTAKTTIIINRK